MAEDYRGPATVVYGHTPVPDAEWLNKTICLDTGVVFGGELTALRWPEKELVAVAANEQYYEPIRPLIEEKPERAPLLLDVGDVLGKHHIETSLAGRVTIDAERSSAALEVMSRFATDPRWLVHLPPTMAPVATSQRLDYLEHPDEAFAYFQTAGVDQVVCEEKHMGSREVLIFAKDQTAAMARFGITNQAAGVIVTRTGRPFFKDVEMTTALLDRVRTALNETGLWDELGTDWFVMDTEILPWSAKALELLKSQYAATGTAASTMLAAACSALAVASARDLEGLGELAARTAAREQHVDGYIEAYRQYCWDTDGLSGIKVAPLPAACSRRRSARPSTTHMAS